MSLAWDDYHHLLLGTAYISVCGLLLVYWWRMRAPLVSIFTSLSLLVGFQGANELLNLALRYTTAPEIIAGYCRITNAGLWASLLMTFALRRQFDDLARLLVASEENQARVTGLQRKLQRLRKKNQRRQKSLRVTTGRLVDAREAERVRIARELHDEIGQALIALKYCMYDFHPPERGPRATAQPGFVERMSREIDIVIQSLRRLIVNLHPLALEREGLCQAIASLARDLEARFRVKIELDLPAEDEATLDAELTPVQQRSVFRITQEALTNALKHSSSETLRVSLCAEPGSFHLCVEDFGTIPVLHYASPGDAMGLMNIRERANFLNAKFSIRWAEGRGTVVEVHIPRTKENRHDQSSYC